MRIEVLDFGYVEFIEAWGVGKRNPDDVIASERDPKFSADYECGIIEAARQSTQGSFRGWDQDAKLLKHLYEHKHSTPFEFAGMTIEVQAPIFVFREWHRHRTQSYSEMSARYAPLPDLYYVPAVKRVVLNGGKNKQAAGIKEGTPPDLIAAQFIEQLRSGYEACEAEYQQFLEWGIPKELARCIMPVGHYSRMRASANLRNWLAFMTLRCDPAAQWEIQVYAGVVGSIVEQIFPQTFNLWFEEFHRV